MPPAPLTLDSKRYDFTIVGAGVGGLALAALLSKRGHVRVLEHQAVPGGKASRRTQGEFVYDEGPSILVLRNVYEDLFLRLGEPLENWLHLDPVPNPFRIQGRGDEAFVLGSSWEESLQNIRAWNSDAASELHLLHMKLNKYSSILGLSYCDRALQSWTDFLRPPLVASGLIVSPLQKYKTFVDAHISNPVMKEFLYGFPGYAGYHPGRAPASMALLPWSLLTEGVFYPRGGISAIPNALYQICLKNGVEFLFETTLKDLVFEKGGSSGKVTEIVTQSGVLPVSESESVVFNGCLGSLASILSHQDSNRVPSCFSKTQLQSYAEQSPSFLTVQTSFPKSVRPAQGLKHHNLFLPGSLSTSYQDINVPGAPLPQDPPLYLNLPSVVDDAVAPKDSENAFLVVSVPSHLGDQMESRKDEEQIAARRYLNLLKEAIPGLVFGETFVRGSIAFEADFLQKGGQIYGPSLDHAQKLFGFARPGPRLSPKGNLWMVGGSTQPGAGLPMVIQSAKIVADMI